MREWLSPPNEQSPELVRRSVVEPGNAVYSIDDDVVVAAVHGRCVELFDGDGVAERFACKSPGAAEREALRYAWLLQRPLLTEEETP